MDLSTPTNYVARQRAARTNRVRVPSPTIPRRESFGDPSIYRPTRILPIGRPGAVGNRILPIGRAGDRQSREFPWGRENPEHFVPYQGPGATTGRGYDGNLPPIGHFPGRTPPRPPVAGNGNGWGTELHAGGGISKITRTPPGGNAPLNKDQIAALKWIGSVTHSPEFKRWVTAPGIRQPRNEKERRARMARILAERKLPRLKGRRPGDFGTSTPQE